MISFSIKGKMRIYIPIGMNEVVMLFKNILRFKFVNELKNREIICVKGTKLLTLPKMVMEYI